LLPPDLYIRLFENVKVTAGYLMDLQTPGSERSPCPRVEKVFGGFANNETAGIDFGNITSLCLSVYVQDVGLSMRKR